MNLTAYQVAFFSAGCGFAALLAIIAGFIVAFVRRYRRRPMARFVNRGETGNV